MTLLRTFLRLPQRPVLWLVTLLHATWGTGLVLIPEKIRFVTSLFPYSGFPRMWGLLMIFSAMLAVQALVYEGYTGQVRAATYWAFIPQQMFLMASAGSCIYFAFVAAHYADGTIVPNARQFIGNDQIVYVLLALLHPIGILRMHLSIFPLGKHDDRS